MADEGTYRASDYIYMLQSMAFTTGSFTTGFSGKRGGVGRYLRGLQPDVVMARKMAGVTVPSRIYGSYAEKHPGLRAFAPTLSHLLPSRMLTYWSALAGNEKALQAIGGFSAVNTARKAAPGRTAKELYRGLEAYGWKGATFKDSIFSSQVSRASRVTFGSYLSPDSNIQQHLRHLQWEAINSPNELTRIRAAEAMGTIGGFDEGRLSSGWKKFITKKMVGSESSAIWKTMGKSIAPASRLLGGAMVGIDLYSMGIFAGGVLEKGFVAGMNAPANFYQGITSGIHRGTFMSSAPLSPFVGQTGRQRALANIYERQLNLRQVLGNEAALLGGM